MLQFSYSCGVRNCRACRRRLATEDIQLPQVNFWIKQTETWNQAEVGTGSLFLHSSEFGSWIGGVHLKLLEEQSQQNRLISALDCLPEYLDDTDCDCIFAPHARYAIIALKWVTLAKVYLVPDESQHAFAVEQDSRIIEEDGLFNSNLKIDVNV